LFPTGGQLNEGQPHTETGKGCITCKHDMPATVTHQKQPGQMSHGLLS